MSHLPPCVRKTVSAFTLIGALGLCAVAHAASGADQQPLIKGHIDETQRVTLPGNVRPEVSAATDRGAVADSMQLPHMQLLLERPAGREAALEAYLAATQTPGDPNYHHWLTAAQIGELYGPTPRDIATVRGWLEAHGFQVNSVSPTGLLIDFSGNAGQVAQAFQTEIHSLDVRGHHHFANMRDPQIPAALAPVIAGIVSLNNFRPKPMVQPRMKTTALAPGRLAGPKDTVNSSYQLVAPADLQTIYNFNPVYNRGIAGNGQTIVVLEDTDLFDNNDYANFRKTFNLDQYGGSSFSVVHPGGCADPGVVVGNDFEATLDAEWAAAAAPQANIVLASCADTQTTFGVTTAMQALLESDHPPSIVSISYGECEAALGAAGNRYIRLLYQLAALEGTSVYVAAGDEGAASCDAQQPAAQYGIAVSGYASTPYNLAAGGTDYTDTYNGANSVYWNPSNTATYGSAKSYIPEMPWDDSCANGPLSTIEGYSTPYGANGFCNSDIGSTYFLAVAGGSGGPSACAYGATSSNPNTPAVSGSCRGYDKPFWQMFLAGVPRDGVRDIPDVSMFAANGLWGHYYPVCYSNPAYYGQPCTGTPDTWAGGGGTSFVAPILAGVQALVNQKTRSRQGNPDFIYYLLATLQYGRKGNPACDSNNGSNACIFHDVTFGDNDVNCTGPFNCYAPSGTNGVLSTKSHAYKPAYAAGAGWDFATGIGTVNVDALVKAWPSF